MYIMCNKMCYYKTTGPVYDYGTHENQNGMDAYKVSIKLVVSPWAYLLIDNSFM